MTAGEKGNAWDPITPGFPVSYRGEQRFRKCRLALSEDTFEVIVPG